MILPVCCSILYQGDDLLPLAVAAVVIFGIGIPLRFFFRSYEDLEIRDGIFIAVFG